MKKRVDELLVEQGHFETQAQAAAAIMADLVRYNRPDMMPVKHAGERVDSETHFLLKTKSSSYVSRGGEKLASALKAFSYDMRGKLVIDAGASSGGFTDCALKAGSVKVIAVDVAYGQFAWTLRSEERVQLLERTNIRDLKKIFAERGELAAVEADLLVADLSFVSLSSIVGALVENLKSEGELILLVKPQFELDEEDIGEGGIVAHPYLHAKALKRASAALIDAGADILGISVSGIRGAKGNKEFFIYAKMRPENRLILTSSEREEAIPLQLIEKRVRD